MNATTESHTDPALPRFLSKVIGSGLEIAGNASKAILVTRY